MVDHSQPEDEHLKGILRSLRGTIDFPATPQLAFAVGSRIRTSPPAAATRPRWVRNWAPLAAVVGVLLLASGVVFGTSSEARAAVEDVLELGGLTIDLDGKDRPETPGALEAQLGPEVSLEAVQRDATFAIALPSSLGEPVAVHRNMLDEGLVITAVYDDAGSDGGTIILTQFHGDVDVYKAAPRSQVEFVEVKGDAAYWIKGPHTVTYPFVGDPTGAPTRVVANVLAWEAGGVTFRLETTLGLAEALAIAESVDLTP